MLKKDLSTALNNQINLEFFSSYIYLAMSAYFSGLNLGGFARWMYLQSLEETEHGMKIFNYIVERGGKVELKGIEDPALSYASPLAAFEAALAHEQKVTRSIASLLELAQSKKDHATEIFLQWFVKEQVEEEANAEDIIHKIKMCKDSPGTFYMLDKELGQREQD
jgi:ferritin